MGHKKQTAVIIGAGPAGLTAALELCRQSDIKPIVLEGSDRIGGISCTIRYNGNRMDIGGHRFFSKSDRVMDWWTEIMPIADSGQSGDLSIRYHNQERHIKSAAKETQALGPVPVPDPDCVMLVRPRKSRIYFMRSFFDYPLSLSAGTLGRLGIARTVKILFSYLKAQTFPRKPENTLEDFLINRFGRELYLTFFKSYTEKVWGVPCDQISAAWGAQRIKGLSLISAVKHFVKKLFASSKPKGDIRQKDSETSLIEQFLYPKYGPGQLWEHVAKQVQSKGGEVRLGWRVEGLNVERAKNGSMRIASLEARTPEGNRVCIDGDFFFSTMPISELIKAIDAPVPEDVRAIADGLMYRDFITVGLLVDRLLLTESDGSMIKDTWIYVQEPDVLVGRIQIFNNWSPYLVSDPSKVWIGLEYFCYDTDELWNKPNAEIAKFAINEVERIGILRADEVRDSCVFRVPKTYPAYFGTYDRFDEIIKYMERYENLFLVGRNGMHKYNNQDHSMLTAMMAVENIIAGRRSKDNLWQVNTEQEYHEEKGRQESEQQPAVVAGPVRATDQQPDEKNEEVA
ncbi:NAD(P)/FAD-dependent oxidoreductase [Occallatibacter savannae]|uniref:NAD(P)/FAD-dependent oxidoreductase n=1 Tax=Occallatibacter savannae TaxID=1002691 RepID=UPI000D688FD5|nr:NAD(P)/FAD-dependent oxidoreductase [Occallatibacter savannae]